MKKMTVQLNGLTINAIAANDYFEEQWASIGDGTQEPLTYKIFNEYIDKETTYIDMGGYIGGTCLYSAQLAKVAYAFEPDPVAFEYLQQNLDSNPHINNLTVYNQACGSTEGVVHLKSTASGGNSGSSILINDFKSSWEVKLIDINKFIKEHFKGGKLFIKIDIEGYEYQLLKDLLPTIQEYKPTIFLALHPHLIAGSVEGRSIIAKIRRRLKMVQVHKDLTNVLSTFPFIKRNTGAVYPLSEINNNILTKGMLEETDKDVLLHF